MSDVPKFKTFRDLRSVPAIPGKDSARTTSISSISSSSSSSSIPRISSTTNIPTKQKTEVSPVRDFQKVPNSVSRNLDLFRGKSKQIWDYLWSMSRGAINPTRTIRKSRKEIKEGAKLGSMVTVDAAIEHLINTGLLKVNQIIGSLGGNEYEIFTPEEIDLTYTSSTSISSSPSLTQKVDILDIPESSISSITQTIENKPTSGDAKTSLKTNTNDDERAVAFSEFFEKIATACKRITGKPVSGREREKWGTLADLLILEFESAARKTESISSAPAFLTEVLRRKLLNTNSSLSKSPKTKSDTVGKPYAEGEYKIKLLNEEERKAALKYLSEFADEDFLQDFKKWYMEDDWNWLMKEIKKIK